MDQTSLILWSFLYMWLGGASFALFFIPPYKISSSYLVVPIALAMTMLWFPLVSLQIIMELFP